MQERKRTYPSHLSSQLSLKLHLAQRNEVRDSRLTHLLAGRQGPLLPSCPLPAQPGYCDPRITCRGAINVCWLQAGSAACKWQCVSSTTQSSPESSARGGGGQEVPPVSSSRLLTLSRSGIHSLCPLQLHFLGEVLYFVWDQPPCKAK